MCGEVKSKKDDKTDSRPLITVSDLQKMKEEEAVILRSRMEPYKTKLKFDYKIDWGKKYPVADYPHREKQPVSVFDLKNYVKEKRDKKINEMLGDTKMPFPSMPGMTPSPMPDLFGPKPKEQGLNVDEIVKRIDAKIAELEAEEKAEKEKQEAEKAKSSVTKETKKVEIPKQSNLKENLNREITDDQFFDDFFNDED